MLVGESKGYRKEEDIYKEREREKVEEEEEGWKKWRSKGRERALSTFFLAGEEGKRTPPRGEAEERKKKKKKMMMMMMMKR
ncbi:hypothetical protein TRV_05568 [Trichophyton verrucosum HKI 0517]|uniref:Uncharacterized protein n=1 Tax=Trichophyton verrucosum (strain HKI 0517) TaxID=663202 RepID=D4DEK1_TRIVH|nr:uncharacterized protein TRV_05568 [Trichophyton verrucosum HKI 0517]EFE39725.1 hypothetical protein TRV_05568 [Trichophyton verrucosum HKI 0517]